MDTKPVCKMLVSASLILCSGTLIAAPLPSPRQPRPAHINKEENAVRLCVSQALQEAEAGDITSFGSHLTSDFCMFERGVRYDTQGLVNILERAQTAGSRMHWAVTQADVHVRGNSAWIAYVNDGSATVGGHSVHRQWLESAFLENSSGTWKISFWHSTPVPASTDPNSAPATKE